MEIELNKVYFFDYSYDYDDCNSYPRFIILKKEQTIGYKEFAKKYFYGFECSEEGLIYNEEHRWSQDFLANIKPLDEYYQMKIKNKEKEIDKLQKEISIVKKKIKK
jgi:hypothetical protein